MFNLVYEKIKKPLAVAFLHGARTGIPGFKFQEFHGNSTSLISSAEQCQSLLCITYIPS